MLTLAPNVFYLPYSTLLLSLDQTSASKAGQNRLSIPAGSYEAGVRSASAIMGLLVDAQVVSDVMSEIEAMLVAPGAGDEEGKEVGGAEGSICLPSRASNPQAATSS